MKIRRILATALLLSIACTAQAEEMPVAVDELLAVESIEDETSIRLAQQCLIDLGMLSGDADGLIGSKTIEAIKAFQTDYGLEITGKLDPATWVALQRALPAPIGEIQQRLIDLGYLTGSADGLWGSKSSAALKLFQSMHDLEPSGKIDAESVERLKGANTLSLPKGIYSGDKGEGVEALQKTLIRYAFLNGRADGKYGPTTAAAVKAFQQHLIDQGIAEKYDITPTGEATPATMFVLMKPDYSSYLQDLRPGDTAVEAERVERRLNQLGYLDTDADEALDDYTMEALELFREKAGLQRDDRILKPDIDQLFLEDAPLADHCAPHDIVLGDSGLMVREVEDALNLCGMTVKLPNGRFDGELKQAIERVHGYMVNTADARAELFSDGAVLTKEAAAELLKALPGYVSDVSAEGGSEQEIYRVQRRLHLLYYLDRDNVDGIFGEKSQSAVEQFQKINGLKVTGTADEATQSLLFSEAAMAKPLPYRVDVSLSRQRVEVYELNDSGEYHQTHSFICSTGLHNSTPRGIFLDGFPVNRWHYFQKFNCWAQYSFEVEGDIMIHSVIYSSPHEGSLRQSSVYNLGGPASHGCIRLEVEAARWLFEHCKRGSLAIVID